MRASQSIERSSCGRLAFLATCWTLALPAATSASATGRASASASAPVTATATASPARAASGALQQDLPSTPAEADPALQALADFHSKKKIDTKSKDWKLSVPQAPHLPFDPWSEYLWHVRTSVGDMSFRLLPRVAPRHVESLIHLSRLGFYDETSFHRVIKDFMAQGGCPLGTGNGYPGYRMSDEFDAAVRHDVAGRLSAANAGPGTDGSQFFVTFAPMPHLDDVHTIFGQLIEGQGALDALNAAGSPDGKPGKAVRLLEATISVRPMSLPRSEDSADPALGALRAAADAAPLDRKKRWRLAIPAPPAVEFSAQHRWIWHLMTDEGPLDFELAPAAAPLQVASVVYLTRLGFYEQLDFFKASAGQGLWAACPRSNGRSFPGYKLEQQIDEARAHERGTLSAPQISKGEEGSQFFVALGEAPRLDGHATIFGRLLDGEETLARLEALIKGSKLERRVVIRSASIEVQ